MAGTPLPVSTTPGGVIGSLGAIEDLGVSQDGARTISVVSPSGSQGDQVEILGGNDPSMDDAFVVGNVFTTNELAGGSADAGQNAALSTSLVFRYARTVRIAGTSALVCEVGAAAPSGGSIANAILNGGQAGPLTAGTTNATSFTLFANDINQIVMASSGNLTLGSTTGTASTQVQSGSGGIGIGVAPTASNTTIDTPAPGGTAALATTNATAISEGGTNITGFFVASVGSGGQMHIGSATADFLNTADSIQFATGNNGPIKATAAGSGAVTLLGGTGGASLDSSGATTVAPTLSTSLAMGNTTGAFAATLTWGTGGCGIGAAAPGSSGLALDTPTAGTIAVGATHATTLNLTGAALATINVGTNALATTLNFGNTTGATSVAVNSGTGGVSVTATGTGTISLASGTGASGWTVGAGGTLNLANDANAHTVNIAHGAAAQTLNLGSTNTTSTTTVSGGSGGVAVDATGGAATLGATTATSTTIGNATSGNPTTIVAGSGAGGGIILSGGVKSSYTAASAITIGSSTVIGTAANTVDKFDIMEVIASVGSLVLTLPAPADTTRAHRFTVINGGAANTFTMYGKVLTLSSTPQTAVGDFFWSPTLAAWLTA
jgi:hypothetical protein